MISFICNHYCHPLHIFIILSFLISSPYHPTLLARAQYITIDDSDSDLNSDSIWNPLYTGIVATILTILFIFFYYVAYTCFIRFCWVPDTEPAQRARDGLDPAILVAFPVFNYSDVAGLGPNKGPLECAVCLSPFEEEETLRLLSKCNHVFHLHCVDRWLAAHTTCPYCRADLISLPGGGESNRLESGCMDESGSMNGVEVESDSVEKRCQIQEGKFIGKIWRWNSTGHLVEIEREEDEETSGLRSSDALRKELINLRRSNSCTITLWTC